MNPEFTFLKKKVSWGNCSKICLQDTSANHPRNGIPMICEITAATQRKFNTPKCFFDTIYLIKIINVKRN